MKRKQNVIIFSAGESVRNGMVEYIKRKIEDSGICCYDWRDLFKDAHNSENIALLPNLSKKIPTFDFALIIAEGVDTVKLRGGKAESAIRDNVIFELGLCTMALGCERVILLAEEGIHIPDDLIGVGKIGVEYITFRKGEIDTSIEQIETFIGNKTAQNNKAYFSQVDAIINHINVNADTVSPVFIGAAVSSAEAYYLNFIIRLLENIDKGFSYRNSKEDIVFIPEKIKIKVLFPTNINSLIRNRIVSYYERENISEFTIKNAGIRDLFFYGIYNEEKNELTVFDIPTSITASYSVVNSILNIESDEDYDLTAEERFITKELDVYAYALEKLLSPDISNQRLNFIKDPLKKERVLEALKKVELVRPVDIG